MTVSGLTIAAIMGILLLVFIFSGYYLFAALGGVAILSGLAFWGPGVFQTVYFSIFKYCKDYNLLAVPLFVLMGQLLNQSGVAGRLFDNLSVALGRQRGGMAIAATLIAILFAATTGIVGASVVSMGLLFVGPMLDAKYNKSLTAGVIVSGGTLGILIPPSIMLVFMGSAANVSVGQLFYGAIVPGLLLGAAYIVYIKIVAVVKKDYAISQRFTHLPALTVPNEAVDKHRVERNLSSVLDAGENHPGNPEENDIIAGDQRAGGIEILVVVGVFQPSQGGEGPERRTEPGVQGIVVLFEILAAAFWAGMRRFFCHHHLAAVGAVVGRNPVSPPKLAGDTPILDVLHPVEIGFIKTLGDKLDFAGADRLNGRFRQRLHFDKPLLGNLGLYRSAATVAGANIVGVILHPDQKSLLLQVFDNGFSGLVTLHTAVFAVTVYNVGVVSQNADDRQMMPQTDFKVIGVVGGGNFHNTGSEFHIHVTVGYNGDFPVHQR